MSNFTYGFVLTVVGMGGTLVGLYCIVLAVDFMKRLFPYQQEVEEPKGKGVEAC